MGLGQAGKDLDEGAGRRRPQLPLRLPLPPSEPGDPTAVRKSRAQGEGDRLPDVGHGDGLGRRGRDRHPPNERGQQGKGRRSGHSAQSRTEGGPSEPASDALPRPFVPLRDRDGADYPDVSSGDRQPVLPLVSRPRLLGMLKPQRPADVHHQRRAKDIDGRRVAAGHPNASRSFQPVDDPALHRVARRGAAQDRRARVS